MILLGLRTAELEYV